MASNIDDTVPATGAALASSPVRANFATAKSEISALQAALVIGTTVQAWDAGLDSLALLGTAADKGIYSTAINTWAEFSLTTAGRALLDDADATAQRATLGLVIGTDVQAYDAELAAISGLTSAADKLPYFTGSGTAALADLVAAARTFLALTAAAGDLPYASATNTWNKLALGAAATQLQVNAGGTAPEWAVYPTFSAHRNNVAQSLASATFTKVQFTTEDWDRTAAYDNATNYRFTPAVAGYYLIIGAVKLATAVNGAGTLFQAMIYKNGAQSKTAAPVPLNTEIGSAIVLAIVSANTTDYFEIYAYQDGGGTEDISGDANFTYFQAMRIG